MNIKELKELIKDLPDDVLVVSKTFDHGYRQSNVYKDTTICYKDDNQMDEDFGEDLEGNQFRRNVLVVDW